MKIMLRHAQDDFDALMTANAMVCAEADVFSITDGGADVAYPCGRFVVWAKVRDDAHCGEVDAEIAKSRRKSGKAVEGSK